MQKLKKQNTSWGNVANWYEKVVSDDASYQNTVIKPNLLRMLNLKAGELVLDVACGSGFFAREFGCIGAKVTGVDIGQELIKIAKQQDPKGVYLVANAEKMENIKSSTYDAAVIILALQNIKNYQNTVSEISRILKPGGRCVVVLNHPAFRVPGKSSWEYDSKQNVQYRRVDSYLTESSKVMDMHPGKKVFNTTYSFHRPLQAYFKAFYKNQLVVENLEEWVSLKKSDSGPRAKAENIARKEFPLFMAIELVKYEFRKRNIRN
ncbi:MAG: class I SAM-dependent methyltransferase [Candidatus Doudnabacteria bacterium]|nr:class I SAM-dependent methyltransferase [Candidatus Doudnabacteria bacterium]